MVASAAAVAVLVVAAWFPAAALYHQHQQLAASSSQLQRLRRQDGALAQETARLESPSEVARIARQQYQLVDPGQQVFEVLPAGGASADGPYAGNPGTQVPVAPSAASELPAGSAPTSSTATAPRRADGSADDRLTPSAGVLGRIVDTLEFWR